MTRHEAYIEKNWETLGLAHLLVARLRDDGSADYAVFLVDLLCLGVKDCFVETDVAESDLRDYVDQRLPDEFRERFHPACARKLIEGAIDYAQSLGFAPHRDFRKARKILAGIDAAVCPRDFVYGRDGRPCYVRGTDDTDQRVDRVLAILAARCGEDGYDYVDLLDDESEPDDLALREDLLTWLDNEPETVPRFYEVSGLITALLICPKVLAPTKVFEALWGPEGRVWKDEKEMQEFARLLMGYWNQLSDRVQDALHPDAHPEEAILDIYPEDFDELDEQEGGISMAIATHDWTRGFLRATELWPEAWGDARTRPDLAPHWEVIGWWAHIDRQEDRDKMIAAAESTNPRTLDPSIKAIARALRPAPRPDSTAN